MNEKQIQEFIKVQSQIKGSYDEVGILSKKNPDGVINEFKLKFINKTLIEANKLLTESYKPFDDFNNFDETKLPFNSDVVFMLSHYLECMEKLRRDNIVNDYGTWYWMADGKQTNMETDGIRRI